ncbi:MAG: DUF421 domain-containing protein [Pirellulaceae bacterium]
MPNWSEMFLPSMSILEIILRGTLMYGGLWAVLRVVVKREAGAVSVTDLLMVVLIAEAAANGLSADYQSVPEGLILASTIVFWSSFLDWAACHFKIVRKIVHPEPLQLVENGVLLSRNLKKEFLSAEDVFSQMRQQGIEKLTEVKAAWMERDGHMSFIKHSGEQPHGPKKKNTT